MFFYFFLREERAYKYGRPRGRDNFQILRPPPRPDRGSRSQRRELILLKCNNYNFYFLEISFFSFFFSSVVILENRQM